jgi:hypothetical protein
MVSHVFLFPESLFHTRKWTFLWRSDVSLAFRLYYRYCNKKKAQILAENPELGRNPNIAFMDFTDKENPVFQYAC